MQHEFQTAQYFLQDYRQKYGHRIVFENYLSVVSLTHISLRSRSIQHGQKHHTSIH